MFASIARSQRVVVRLSRKVKGGQDRRGGGGDLAAPRSQRRLSVYRKKSKGVRIDAVVVAPQRREPRTAGPVGRSELTQWSYSLNLRMLKSLQKSLQKVSRISRKSPKSPESPKLFLRFLILEILETFWRFWRLSGDFLETFLFDVCIYRKKSTSGCPSIAECQRVSG